MKIKRLSAAVVTATVVLLTLYFVWPRPIPASSIQRLPEYQDQALLQRAWALPVAKLYGPSGFMFQSNPSTCGPTSVADLLLSEGKTMTPAQVLEGSGIYTLIGIIPLGLTLDQEASLLRLRTGKTVTVLRNLSLDQFRQMLARSNDPAHRIIANFARSSLFGSGVGHFSPVLGYLADRDLVFVGDVNGHYSPWLTSTARLYAAQDTLDTTSGAKRGLLDITER